MRTLLLAVTIFAGFTQASFAGSVEQQVIRSLQAQGYQVLEQSYTFLGRLRIVAQNGSLQREIVVNPGTGEILRDYAVSMPQHGADEINLPVLAMDGDLPETVAPDIPDGMEPYFVTNGDTSEAAPSLPEEDPAPGAQSDEGAGEMPADPAGLDFVITGMDQAPSDQPTDPVLP